MGSWWFMIMKWNERPHFNPISLSLISNFVECYDSRSFLSIQGTNISDVSYVIFGTLVETGRYPNDRRILKKLIEDISYNNSIKYFGFDN